MPAQGDDVYIDPGSVTVGISGASVPNATFENLVISGPATAQIADTIDLTTISLSGPGSVDEGSSATYTVTLSNVPQTAVTVSINYSFGSASAGDISTSTTSVLIPAGQTSAQFTVGTVSDSTYEGSQTFSVSISNPSGGNFESLAVGNASVSTTINDANVLSDGNESAMAQEDGQATGNVLDNTFNPDGPTAASVTGFSWGGSSYGAGAEASIEGVGTLIIDAGGGFLFVPAPDYNGSVPSATYSVTDGVDTDVSTLALSISAVDDPITDGNETNSTNEDTTLTVLASSDKGLLYNTTPNQTGDGAVTITKFTWGENVDVSAGQTASITGVGTLKINADGGYVFTPAANYNGQVPVATYSMSDDGGLTVGDTSTLSINVIAPPITYVGDETAWQMNNVGSFDVNFKLKTKGNADYATLSAERSIHWDILVSSNADMSLATGDAPIGTTLSFEELYSNDEQTLFRIYLTAGATDVTLSNSNSGGQFGVNIIGMPSRTGFAVINSDEYVKPHSNYGDMTPDANGYIWLSTDMNGGELATDPGTATTSGDTEGTTSADVIYGSAGNDANIKGGDGHDFLDGRAGSDTLIGGAGNDVLAGGIGADVFKWSLDDAGTDAAPAVDHITDFSRADGDVINLADLLPDAATTSNIASYLTFDEEGGKAVLSVITDANGDAEQKIVFDNMTLAELESSFSTAVGETLIQKMISDNKLVI